MEDFACGDQRFGVGSRRRTTARDFTATRIFLFLTFDGSAGTGVKPHPAGNFFDMTFRSGMRMLYYPAKGVPRQKRRRGRK